VRRASRFKLQASSFKLKSLRAQSFEKLKSLEKLDLEAGGLKNPSASTPGRYAGPDKLKA
jgi:hypothetical protein